MNLLLLAIIGLGCGILSGFLGIGGGTVLVPLLVTLGYTPVHAVATTSLAVVITAISGSVQNWRMGYFSLKRVVSLGLPGLVTTQLGVYLANRINAQALMIAFAILLLVNVYLVELRKRLTNRVKQEQNQPQRFQAFISEIYTAKADFVLAGLFTVTQGVILLLQMLLFNRPLEVAIKTNFGDIIITPILLIDLGILLIFLIYLVESIQLSYLIKSLEHLKNGDEQTEQPKVFAAVMASFLTGGLSGILAGLFGIGGGAILVPLQILLLNESLKVAIQTSLGVILITSISACIGHTLSGNVLFLDGIILGAGGFVGAQFSTRYLPKIPEKVVSLAFRGMLLTLSVYMVFLIFGMQGSAHHR